MKGIDRKQKIIIPIAGLLIIGILYQIYRSPVVYATDFEILSTVSINNSTVNGPTLSDGGYYGRGVAGLGDLNGDGVEDLAVSVERDNSVPSERGAFYIHYLNTNGSLDSSVKIDDNTANGPTLSNYDSYGISIANIGDLDNDGVEDIAVGAYGDDAGGSARGAVHIHFMNTNGSIDSTVEINDTTTNGPTLANGDGYGFSVTGMGDLNGDGVEDVAVGAYGDDTGGSGRGAVYISFLNTDGSIDSTVKIDDTTTNGPVLGNIEFYGHAIANIGDLNSDGVVDVAVGAPRDDTAGYDRGTIYISFLNTDGSIDSTVEINGSTINGPASLDEDLYGSSIANMGDLNGDGIQDLAVGAQFDVETTLNPDLKGNVYIHYMNRDGSIKQTLDIDDDTLNGPDILDSSFYGTSVANIGDLNDDDQNDLAVGAPYIDDALSERGEVHISFLAPADPSVSSNHHIFPANVSVTYDETKCYELNDTVIFTQSGENISWQTIADNELFIGAQWEPYTTEKQVTLTKLGKNTFYFLFMASGEGNRSNVIPISMMVEKSCDISMPISPLPESIVIGDLVKLPDDGKSYTTQDSVVYWIQNDNKRHAFLNQALFNHWFPSDQVIKQVSQEILSSIPIGDAILPKPGTWIRIQSIPAIYEVMKDGITIVPISIEDRTRALQDPMYVHVILELDISFWRRFRLK